MNSQLFIGLELSKSTKLKLLNNTTIIYYVENPLYEPPELDSAEKPEKIECISENEGIFY